MTDIVDAQETVQEDQPLPILTVAQFIKDLSSFPQDSEIMASVFGIGMTIPIYQAFVVEADGKDLAILQMSKEGTVRALTYGMQEEQKARLEASDVQEVTQ